MNIIAWLLALTLIVTVMIESVSFYKASVCRQKAWLKGTELITRSLLHRAPKHEWSLDAGCRTYVSREYKLVRWQRIPHIKRHTFQLTLQGKI